MIRVLVVDDDFMVAKVHAGFVSRVPGFVVAGVAHSGAGDLSASECAERTGLSRVSARRYLEHFTASGLLEVRLRYGAAGRPERRYAWRSG